MRTLYIVAMVLVVIGGINWGLVGFFDWNLVDALFGEGSALARIIYSAVGVAALYILIAKMMMPSGEAAKKRAM